MAGRPSYLWRERSGRVRTVHQTVNAPSFGPGAGAQPSREVIVKVVSGGKSQRAARRLMEYISKDSDHVTGETALYDEWGNALKTSDAQQVVESWELLSDQENLSVKARGLSKSDAKKLPEDERLKSDQFKHIVISLPSNVRLPDEALVQVAQDALEPFREAEFQYVFALHREHKNQHIHVAIKKRSRADQTLKLYKPQIQEFRERVARSVRELGLEAKATPKRYQDQQAERRPPRQLISPILSNRAELFVQRHGADIAVEKSQAKLRRPLPPPVKVNLPPLPEKTKAKIEPAFEKMFADPVKAQGRYLELSIEDRKTANWYLENSPEIYGKVKNQAAYDSEIARAPLPMDWRVEARRALHEAVAKESLDIQQSRLRTIGALDADRRAWYEAQQAFKGKPALTPETQQTDTPKPNFSQVPKQYQAVPDWYARHGVRVEADRTGQKVPGHLMPAPARINTASLPPATQQRMDVFFQARFERPEAAKAAFIEMAAENVRNAFWSVNNLPHVFGELKPQTVPARASQGEWVLPTEWREEAKRDLERVHALDFPLKGERAAFVRELRAEPTLPEKMPDRHKATPTHGAKTQEQGQAPSKPSVKPKPNRTHRPAPILDRGR
ncbi:MAG: relaxase/mobilization nuclease domain-containing protein [Alphaproteobacteria bacterium]|nr:relaxase/mobilization nuclease domain-containing protein [Alphaproteobacteria bacterium]